MNVSLEKLVQRVIVGSMAMIGMTGSAAATPPAEPEKKLGELDPALTPEAGTVVLKERRPRLVLTKLSGSAAQLYTSHRSHRSHSSHRSHYSSAQPAPARPPAQPRTPEAAANTVTLGTRVLRKGMSGPDVAELMLLLLKHNHLMAEGVNTASLFTDPVEQAVKSFQAANGLTADGEVGAETVLRLKSASTEAGAALGARLLRKGMSGPDVGELMLLLAKHQYLKPQDINTQNLFTDAVEAAVRAFQGASGLAVDGQVSSATAQRLREPR